MSNSQKVKKSKSQNLAILGAIPGSYLQILGSYREISALHGSLDQRKTSQNSTETLWGLLYGGFFPPHTCVSGMRIRMADRQRYPLRPAPGQEGKERQQH